MLLCLMLLCLMLPCLMMMRLILVRGTNSLLRVGGGVEVP